LSRTDVRREVDEKIDEYLRRGVRLFLFDLQDSRESSGLSPAARPCYCFEAACLL